MRHANVALFVPNNGCPHACSFCNQMTITGKNSQPTPEDVRQAAETALESLGPKSRGAEIAFFGGSFTAVERGYMVSLLEAAAPYVRRGDFSGIRISTRPDAVGEEVLSLLKRYGVTTVELGAQSMDDAVLALNGRGHSVRDVVEASGRIRSMGFALGLQMMTGLYGDTAEGALETARRIAELMPSCVRIYPTIVLSGTRLGKLYREGAYQPFGLEETVGLCAELLDFFEGRGIPVIRLGLHASPELERDRLAGPWHPAFRELCESRRMLVKIRRELSERKIPAGGVKILVHPSCVSIAVGQKRANLRALQSLGYAAEVKADSAVEPLSFLLLPSTVH
jgi:histone acetyltransferase (RNA polymerase elongator complex component)